MQRRKSTINFEYLYNLAWHKRFHIFLPLIISLIIGIMLSNHLPKIYEAKTMILVEPQRVPGEFVRSIVQQDIRSRIGTISQQILSRSNLEKVMNKLQLLSEPQYQKMYMEDKLEALRDRISVQVSRAGGGADAFSIVYRGAAPESVMQAANMLSALFIEANLQIREEQAEGTSSFLDEELENMRQKLGRIESNLQSYRQIHMGELPEQLQGNLKFLETFRVQMEQKKEALKNERNRLVIADNEIEQLKINFEREKKGVYPVDSGSHAGLSPGVGHLELLREELKNLKSRYTGQHPSVVQLKKNISELEKETRESVNIADPEDKKVQILKAPMAQSSSERILNERIRQRSMITSSISGLQEDISRIDRQIQEYQKRIESTPKREEELFALKRDHDNLESAYNSLLSRKIEADMAVSMEKKRKGEQFQVLDYAKLPERPISPDLKKIFLLSLVGGLTFGLVLAFATDMTAETVRQKSDLHDMGLPVLAAVPICRTVRSVRRKIVRAAATVGSISAASVLTIIFVYIILRR